VVVEEGVILVFIRVLLTAHEQHVLKVVGKALEGGGERGEKGGACIVLKWLWGCGWGGGGGGTGLLLLIWGCRRSAMGHIAGMLSNGGAGGGSQANSLGV